MSPGTAAQAVGAGRATDYRWWARNQAASWAGLQERPRPPVVRYERASPGELLHLDTKNLGRF